MKEAETWYSISVTAAPEVSESIEYAFNALEALGTEINYLQQKNSENVTVVGYFNEMPDEERVQDELHYALSAYGFTEESVTLIERRRGQKDADWLAEWKKHWRPTEVGGFIVAPTWCDVPDGDRLVIRIEPNMAFGTGTHETTQLCLRAIEKYYAPGDSFLDVGTGTGILAIAAAKVNAKTYIPSSRLVACDTDADAIEIARENAMLNDAGTIAFFVEPISDKTPKFDFVSANLTLDVIVPILPLLLAKAEKTLVLSGILRDQKAEIIREMTALGVEDAVVEQAGEWISVVRTSAA